MFFITFIILLLIGVPISISIGTSVVLGCLILGYPLMIIGQKIVAGVDSYLPIATPLFILAGNLMNAGRITDKIFSFTKELVGWILGGLGHTNIVASIIFVGMSGSTATDAGGLGTIEMEAVTKSGYRDNFSGTVTAASSVIRPMLPPSIPLVIYDATANVSVAKLLMGGVLPDPLMGVALMVLVFIFAMEYRFERHPFDIIALSKQFSDSILSLITPLIILTGFTLESFTPTEASSIAVAYSLVVVVVAYRTIDWKTFKSCLLESAITSTNTLSTIGTSTLFTYVLVKEETSKAAADFILGISSNSKVILLIINVVLLILGMFMEPGAILTLMLLVLLPVVKDLNIDLVHLGVVMVLNLMIGQVTPPFSICLFAISDVTKIKLDKLYRSIIPFLTPLIIVLLMYTYVPDIVIWLPNLLVK